jgi:hypothetical protein
LSGLNDLAVFGITTVISQIAFVLLHLSDKNLLKPATIIAFMGLIPVAVIGLIGLPINLLLIGLILFIPLGMHMGVNYFENKIRVKEKDTSQLETEFIVSDEKNLKDIKRLVGQYIEYAKMVSEGKMKEGYKDVVPGSDSGKLWFSEDEEVILGSAGYVSCIAIAITGIKENKRVLYLDHFLPWWLGAYQRLSSLIGDLRKEGVKDVGLIVHTASKDMQMGADDLAEALRLSQKNVVVIPKEKEKRFRSNVIATSDGVCGLLS